MRTGVLLLLLAVASVATAEAVLRGEPGSKLKCEACKLAIKEVYHLVDDKQMDIAEAISHMCKVVPKAFRDQCHDLVDELVQQLVELIEARETPKHACQAVHWCKE